MTLTGSEMHSTAAKSNNERSKGIFNNTAGFSTLITVTVLSLAWLAGFASRLFAVIRFESIIHEFDPWYVSPHKSNSIT